MMYVEKNNFRGTFVNFLLCDIERKIKTYFYWCEGEIKKEKKKLLVKDV